MKIEISVIIPFYDNFELLKRAQAVTPEGKLVDDFLIQESSRVIHVGNAPSPAATSSLNIGRLIVEKLEAHF